MTGQDIIPLFRPSVTDLEIRYVHLVAHFGAVARMLDAVLDAGVSTGKGDNHDHP